MGGGANSSSSTSKPLTSAERFGNFAGSMGALSATAVRPEFDSAGNVINAEDVVNTGRAGFGDLSTYNTPDYQQAQIVDPGAARTSGVVDSGAARISNISDPGQVRQLAGGDYNRLEQNMLESRMAPLQYALSASQKATDEDLAKRGIWSSGLAIASQNNLADKFAPELRAAAADAATARYGAEQADLNAANQYGLARSSNLNQSNLGQNSMLNSFNLNRASNLNQANLGQDTMTNTYNQNRAGTLNQAGQFDSAQRNSFEMENANRRNAAKWAPANYLAGVYNGTGGQTSSGSGGGWNFNI